MDEPKELDLKLLVVEDDASLNKLIVKNLGREGYQVEGVLTGNDALERIRSNGDLFLLLDYKLPDMSAKEFVDIILEENLETPFLIMTGNGDERVAVEMMKMGAKDYIVKDSTFLELLPTTLQRIIQELITEDRLCKTQEELESSEARFRALIESTHDMIQSVDTKGNIIFVNQAWMSTLGYSKEELDGLNIFKVIHPDYVGHCREMFARIMTGESVTDVSAIFIKKDGSVIHVEGNVVPRIVDGEVTATQGFFRDITERVEAEDERARFMEKLEKLNLELMQANKLKDEFLANTSHELRTPLNSIMGLLKLCLDGLCKDEQEKEEFVQIAYDNSKHLLTIINDILELARIESGTLKARCDEVDIRELLNDVDHTFKTEMEQKNLTFKVKVPPNGLNVINSDKRMLRQILVNLVGNSMKFTPSGSIEIHTRGNKNDNLMFFEVKDTGIGIQPEKIEQLYKPFFQGDGSSKRRYGGTGLGLAICKDLVELMHGGIEVISDGPGEGTCVRFWIPITPEEVKT